MKTVETIAKKESGQHVLNKDQTRRFLSMLWRLFRTTIIVFIIAILTLMLGILSMMEIFSVRSALSVLHDDILISPTR